ncbi:ras-related protein Rab-7L1-like [Prorops nasuta]|uniref:ras-related protein Rab-7L1-like n=1 Tax=Prorops nasuta TaxID=863751 RepID=UPI0034CFA5AB
MKKWLIDLREKITLPDGSSIPVVLLANKCDIRHTAVASEQIVKFCKENNIGAWYVTSAKENTNVDEAMRYLVESALKAKLENGIRDSVRLRDSYVRVKSGCCKT